MWTTLKVCSHGINHALHVDGDYELLLDLFHLNGKEIYSQTINFHSLQLLPAFQSFWISWIISLSCHDKFTIIFYIGHPLKKYTSSWIRFFTSTSEKPMTSLPLKTTSRSKQVVKYPSHNIYQISLWVQVTYTCCNKANHEMT